MKRHLEISEIIKPLECTPFQIYISDCIQAADVLEYCLDYCGKSVIKLSSFSIAEESLRRIFFIRKKGLIHEITMILDYKATQKTLILWPFIHQTIEKVFMADNHSKLIIIESVSDPFRKVAVVMSQNLTWGNRYECAAITTDCEAVIGIRADYDFIINNKSLPFNEVYARAIEAD